MKKTFLLVMIFISLTSLFSCGDSSKTNTDSMSWPPQLSKEAISDAKKIMDTIMIDQSQALNMLSDLRLAGINNIDLIEKTNNWASGERYIIKDGSSDYRIYLNSDKTLNSVNQGLNKIYTPKK